MSPRYPTEHHQGADRAGQDRRVELADHHQGLPRLQRQETKPASLTRVFLKCFEVENKNFILKDFLATQTLPVWISECLLGTRGIGLPV